MILRTMEETAKARRREEVGKKTLSWSCVVFLALSPVILSGCGAGEAQEKEFFTSGSREADQRAQQRIAKTQQLRGKSAEKDGAVPAKKDLYTRLGEEKGLTMIVDDFVNRCLADPRVNWERKGVKRSGFGFHRGESLEWKPTSDQLTKMKQHIVQFLTVATGGPTVYQGGEMKQVHQGLQISNAEFDAAVGDLKATLDKLAVPTDDQKELLALVESTRSQIVEER